MVFGKVSSLLIVFPLRRNTGNCWMWEFRHLLDFVASEINFVNMYVRVTKQVLLYSLPSCIKWIPLNVEAKLLYRLLLLEIPHYMDWNLIHFCARFHPWIQWLCKFLCASFFFWIIHFLNVLNIATPIFAETCELTCNICILLHENLCME